jgi:hypothetical protein
MMRLRNDVRDAAERAAKVNNRSLASYIETCVIKVMADDGYWKDPMKPDKPLR